MRADIAAAERGREVRDAIRSWRRAGFIGAESEAKALPLFPDDRKRLGPGFRVLNFIFACIAIWAVVGLFGFANPAVTNDAGFFGFWALVLTGLTELQRGPWKRADAGAEVATALMAAAFAIITGLIAANHIDNPIPRLLTTAFVVCAIAAWRWGDALFFLGASFASYGLLAQFGLGRFWWTAAALLLIPSCLAIARSESAAPSYRRGAMIVGAVSVLALYGAIHIWSWDEHLIESMNSLDHSGQNALWSRPLRSLTILATALLPPGLLLLGWRRREPLLLYGGLLLTGVSIATIRLYYQVMPLSFALILIGAACLALALGVRRFLRAGDEGERHGFTADPLLDNSNRTQAIQAVVTMASFTPAAKPPSSRGGFEGGGGSFGGGGASGSY